MVALRIRAVLALSHALRDQERGKVDAAWANLSRGLELLNRIPPSNQNFMDTAKAYQLGAEIQLAKGQLELGLDWYAKAEDLFEKHFPTREDYGRCLHDMANVFINLNLHKVALQYAEKALKVLRGFGDPYVQDTERMISHLKEGWVDETEEWDPQEYDRRQKAREQATSPQARAKAAEDFFHYVLRTGHAGEQLTEIHEALHEVYLWAESSSDLPNKLAVLSSLVDMYWEQVPLPKWTDDVSISVVQAATKSGLVDLEAQARTIRAAVLASSGLRMEALDECLRATALNDILVLGTESSAVRALTNLTGCAPRELALDMAVALDDAQLAAELLESARLQVLPDVAAPKIGISTGVKSQAGMFRGFASSTLTELRPISVGGTSHLASGYAASAVGSTIELRNVIEAVGGPKAWWWGAWAVNGRVYWAVLGDEDSACGSIDMAEGGELHGLVMRAMAASLLNDDATNADILSGPWCRTSQSEADLSAALGDELIPEPLRKRLLAARGSGEGPLSVVLAGNLFGLLPVPLLGVGARRGFGDRPRLLELAVLRTAPPAVLVERINAHPLYWADVRPIALSCVDPNSNLEFAGGVPEGSRRSLSGKPSEPASLATKANVINALRAGDMCEPAVFYYSGHGQHEGSGGDVGDGLALSDGTLTAQEIFDVDSLNRPVIPFPERSLISACQLAGARGAGAGEWLGLSAAMLWAGGRQVVSTHWRIWDTPFTRRFDLELAELMRKDADPAESLRRLQLEYLDAWRLSLHDLSDESRDGLPERYLGLPFPLIWAAYCCAGVIG